MKGQLFSFSVVNKLNPSCILLESYGLYKSENNETTFKKREKCTNNRKMVLGISLLHTLLKRFQ